MRVSFTFEMPASVLSGIKSFWVLSLGWVYNGRLRVTAPNDKLLQRVGDLRDGRYFKLRHWAIFHANEQDADSHLLTIQKRHRILRSCKIVLPQLCTTKTKKMAEKRCMKPRMVKMKFTILNTKKNRIKHF